MAAPYSLLFFLIFVCSSCLFLSLFPLAFVPPLCLPPFLLLRKPSLFLLHLLLLSFFPSSSFPASFRSGFLSPFPSFYCHPSHPKASSADPSLARVWWRPAWRWCGPRGGTARVCVPGPSVRHSGTSHTSWQTPCTSWHSPQPMPSPPLRRHLLWPLRQLPRLHTGLPRLG